MFLKHSFTFLFDLNNFEYVCILTHFNILGFHTESISSVDGYKFNLVDPDIISQHMKLFNVSIQGYTT